MVHQMNMIHKNDEGINALPNRVAEISPKQKESQKRRINGETDSEGYTSIVYTPQIEYKVGEQLVTAKGNGSSNASDHTIGEQIEIMYNPDNIEEHMIKGDNSSKIGGIIWIVLGSIILLVGVVKFLTGR